MVGTLWKHQASAVARADDGKPLALFFEQGTGKTRTLIEILRRRYARAGRVENTLIFAPKIVCEKWKEEFKRYSKIPPQRIFVLKGTGKQRLQQWQKACELYGKDFIAVTNYEAVEMKDLLALVLSTAPEVLVCDESQRLKSPTSIRSKKVQLIGDLVKVSYLLSGTPILDGLGMDIFQQYRILDKGETFGRNFFSFRAAYFFDKNAGMPKAQYFPNWQVNPRLIGEYQKRVDSRCMRVLKKDCLDLPPLIRKEVYDELTPEQSKVYKQMTKEFIAWLEDQDGKPVASVASLAVTKALRLQQITTGFINTDSGIVRIKNTREQVLKEVLESIPANEKVIIWAVHRENYSQIAEVCTEVGRKYTELHGGIDGKLYAQNVHDFRTASDTTVLIANQGAGGVGIDLVEAKYAVYFSKNFKLEDDLQSEARNYRGGSEQHDSIIRIDIICKDTIDELIDKRLRNKMNQGTLLLDLREELK